MIAHRRDDVRDLNEAARTLMLRAGRLGPETCVVGEREFRIDDRVVGRQNDLRLGIRNGTRATIVALDETALTLRTDTGELRPVPPEYAVDHLDHGYALTGHAAQGATVERAFVLFRGQSALRVGLRHLLPSPSRNPPVPRRRRTAEKSARTRAEPRQRPRARRTRTHRPRGRTARSRPGGSDEPDDRPRYRRAAATARAAAGPRPSSDSPKRKRNSTNSAGAAAADAAPSCDPSSPSSREPCVCGRETGGARGQTEGQSPSGRTEPRPLPTPRADPRSTEPKARALTRARFRHRALSARTKTESWLAFQTLTAISVCGAALQVRPRLS